MQIALTTHRAGRRGDWPVGSILETPKDISAEEARRLLESGQAVPVRSRPVETTSRRGRPRKIETAAD